MSLRKPIFISDQGYSQEMDGYVDSINLSAIAIIDSNGDQKISLDGYSGNLNVAGETTLASAKVSNLTDTCVVFAGADGSLSTFEFFKYQSGILSLAGAYNEQHIVLDGYFGDAAFDSSVTVGGPSNGVVSVKNASDAQVIRLDGVSGDGYFAGNLNVLGEATLASAIVSDLTEGRMVFAGVNGALVDSADLAFDGSNFSVGSGADGIVLDGATGDGYFSGNLDVLGEATLASAIVSDLTQHRVTFAGANGALVDSANMVFNVDGANRLDITGWMRASNGITSGLPGENTAELTSNGPAYIGQGSFDGQLYLNQDVAGRLYIVGDDLSVKDESKLTFDGSKLSVTGDGYFSGALEVMGAADLAASGVATNVRGTLNVAEAAILDSTLGVTGAVDFASTLNVHGESTLDSVKVSILTETRVVFAGADGALVDDGALTFASNALTIGAFGAAGSVSVKDSSGAQTIALSGAAGDGYFAGKLNVGALALNVDGYAFIQNLQMPTGLDASGLDAVNRDYVDTLVNAASDSSFSDFTAAESLALGNPVFIDAAGKAAKAMANSVDDAKAWVMGVAKAAASADASVEIIRDGVCAGALTGLSFAAGDQIWLDSAGGLANARPLASGDRLILVGFAKTADDLFVDIRDYGKNV